MSHGSGHSPPDPLLARRERAMGPTYRLFYREPVHLVRGEGVWLFDAGGRRYLDCYNNVASVGHCHPDVVTALCRQAGTLNTHTRYLHENVVEYAERLLATLPEPLEVCLFVCTGTEANDLAFRIARTVTGHRGALVSEHAYHGNSHAVTWLSTDEYPAERRPDWLATIPAPDTLRRGPGRDDPDWPAIAARDAKAAIGSLAERGHRPALFLADMIFDADGIQVAPPGWFREVYAAVRAAGGLCIADEVQSGLCRLGEHTWGFMDHGVVPDIVTMGKPLGDGHPLAAVATTRDIAQAFAREHHYFNTFGGNPVSAAVGLAVLDVIEREGILDRVGAVGRHLGAGLAEVAETSPHIAEVRGKGLFWGLELVQDRAGKASDAQRAARLCQALLERGILSATSGPHSNVLKIRPPLVFGREHADHLLSALAECLHQTRGQSQVPE